MPPLGDTPPVSPSPLEDTEDEINQEDIIQVIQLDDIDQDGMEEQEEEEEMEEEDLPVEDNSERQFGEHKKSVFCCCLHPKEPLVATGGEDDHAYIWKAQDGQVVFKHGFRDSVISVSFSHDGTYFAACDMSGYIKVFKTPDWQSVWEFEISDITWMDWHPSANVLLATTIDSELWFWKIPSGESKFIGGHGEKAEVARLLPDGRRVAVGFGDGTVKVLDLKSAEVVHQWSKVHQAAVTSMAVRTFGGQLLATGGVDGEAKLFNLQSGKCIGTFSCGQSSTNSSQDAEDEEIDSKNAVEDIAFSTSEEHNFLITGCLNGIVNVWDLSTQVSRQAFQVGSGVIKMHWSNFDSNLMLVATLDGLLRAVDVRTGKVVADCKGHTQGLLDFSQSKDGKQVVTTSDDGTSRLFDLTKILAEQKS